MIFTVDFFHKLFFKQYFIHNGNSLSFLRSLAQYTAQGEDFIKKLPHPNLLPEPCMAQEKELSILISLPINNHLLIYERALLFILLFSERAFPPADPNSKSAAPVQLRRYEIAVKLSIEPLCKPSINLEEHRRVWSSSSPQNSIEPRL